MLFRSKNLRLVFITLCMAGLVGLGLYSRSSARMHFPQDPIPFQLQEVRRVELRDPEIGESSGLSRSFKHPSRFWTHNDSGDKPRLFLIDTQGETEAVANLTLDQPIDWEDMASFEWEGTPYLVVGDIGGNSRAREHVWLHIFAEPTYLPSEANPQPSQLVVDQIATLEVTIPGGVTNYEAMAVDSAQGTILLVEKSYWGARVYTLPLRIDVGRHPVVAEEIAFLPIPMATASDLSSDGSRLAIGTYTNLVLYERRRQADGHWEAWADCFRRAPFLASLPQVKQAEAVSFGSDADSLFITSEKLPAPLVELRIVKPQ